ncbi:MAG: EamA family transporter [Deltaproteobacteria bacterium]|nr:EamA family transporter [Deltaproteobacteria bacterium]
MSGTAIAVVLFSALLHALWNLFNKGSGDRWGFFLGQGIVLACVYGPVALWLSIGVTLSKLSWLWISLSAITHVFYAIYLLKAYDAGDLSVAYPLSRTAPVLVAGWDLMTTRGVLTAAGVSGTLLAGFGVLLLQLPAVRSQGLRAVWFAPVTRYALTTALFVAGFTIIDKQGVQVTPPFLYLYLLSLGESLLLALWLGSRSLARVRAEFRSNGRSMLFSGVVGAFGYLLILWALTASPASYVLGLRQCSIVFGVLLGRFVLGEGETRYRLVGAGVIAAGSAMIAIFG